MILKVITSYEIVKDNKVMSFWNVNTEHECNNVEDFDSIMGINGEKLGAVERQARKYISNSIENMNTSDSFEDFSSSESNL